MSKARDYVTGLLFYAAGFALVAGIAFAGLWIQLAIKQNFLKHVHSIELTKWEIFIAGLWL